MLSSQPFTDYYKILGVSRESSSNEIKIAYKGKALDLHPDKNPKDPNATKSFQKLIEAYNTLCKSATRDKYNAEYDGGNDKSSANAEVREGDKRGRVKKSRQDKLEKIYSDFRWKKGPGERERILNRYRRKMKSTMKACRSSASGNISKKLQSIQKQEKFNEVRLEKSKKVHVEETSELSDDSLDRSHMQFSPLHLRKDPGVQRNVALIDEFHAEQGLTNPRQVIGPRRKVKPELAAWKEAELEHEEATGKRLHALHILDLEYLSKLRELRLTKGKAAIQSLGTTSNAIIGATKGTDVGKYYGMKKTETNKKPELNKHPMDQNEVYHPPKVRVDPYKPHLKILPAGTVRYFGHNDPRLPQLGNMPFGYGLEYVDEIPLSAPACPLESYMK